MLDGSVPAREPTGEGRAETRGERGRLGRGLPGVEVLDGSIVLCSDHRTHVSDVGH